MNWGPVPNIPRVLFSGITEGGKGIEEYKFGASLKALKRQVIWTQKPKDRSRKTSDENCMVTL